MMMMMIIIINSFKVHWHDFSDCVFKRNFIFLYKSIAHICHIPCVKEYQEELFVINVIKFVVPRQFQCDTQSESG